MHRDAARRLPEDGDVLRIAAERGDVLLHPFEGGDLVHVGVVALGLVRMLVAQRREGEETEAPQTVVERDEDDALLGELDPRRPGRGAAAEHEGAAVDPHHDRQLRVRRGPGGSPHIDEQAIFRRVPARSTRSPARKPACAQSAPNLLASRSPSHAGSGWGGRQRLAPTGAAA